MGSSFGNLMPGKGKGNTRKKDIEQAAIDIETAHTKGISYSPSAPTSVEALIRNKFKDKKKHNWNSYYNALIHWISVKLYSPELPGFLDDLSKAKTAYDKKPSDAIPLLDKICNKFVKKDLAMSLNLLSANRVALLAAQTGLWNTETNPYEGEWFKAEKKTITMFWQNMQDGHFEESEIYLKWAASKKGKQLLDSLARQEYMNVYNSYNSIYGDYGDYVAGYEGYNYESVPYRSQIAGISDGGYVYNSNVFDPTLIILVGLMVCLCFMFLVFVNMISCVGCYAFGRYNSRIMGGIKAAFKGKRNDYENVEVGGDDYAENVV
eukprot:292303_1